MSGSTRPPPETLAGAFTFRGLLLAALCMSCAGCSEFAAPTSQEFLTRPLGTSGPFKRGTPKEAVLEAWGQPDRVIPQGLDELGNVREEWVYTGRMPSIPVDYEYVSRTQHLFFEGNSMVRWESESPAEAPAKAD